MLSKLNINKDIVFADGQAGAEGVFGAGKAVGWPDTSRFSVLTPRSIACPARPPLIARAGPSCPSGNGRAELAHFSGVMVDL